MRPITDRERKVFGYDTKCDLCKKLISAGTECYVRQRFIVCRLDRIWMEKNVAPDPIRGKHKRKPRVVSQRRLRELQDLRDTSHYTKAFGRHLAVESKNIVGIRRAIRDYEGTSEDW